jgi:hypothetical protein
VRIETNQDFQTAIARLASRAPETLATFIASLAFDIGPIGEQVRTFIVGDNLAETTASLKERIEALRGSHSRHRANEEVGERLGYILDSIEALVLPVSPATAFELLVLLIERDGDAMEQCGDDHYSVQEAARRPSFKRVQGPPPGSLIPRLPNRTRCHRSRTHPRVDLS